MCLIAGRLSDAAEYSTAILWHEIKSAAESIFLQRIVLFRRNRQFFYQFVCFLSGLNPKALFGCAKIAASITAQFISAEEK
jgi:hypothetical protein